jgi:hypothetical protein
MVSPIEIEGLKVSNSSIYGQASKNAWSRSMAEIYGLFSGRDGRVRYIGQTRGCCSDRFEQHKRSPSPKLRKWFHDEWRAGYPIEYVMLQPCDDEFRFEAERHWMTGFSGLLNERMSGQIWLTAMCRTCHPKVPEIKAYIRRYMCNAGGFRGVRYDRHWDCYQVLMYTGSGVEWLFGDECDEMIPGWAEICGFLTGRLP